MQFIYDNHYMSYQSTKLIELGSAAFRQPRAESHCKFVHGYRLTAKVWFSADELDGNNWVVDFGGLKNLKKQLEDVFDHKLIVSKDDPLLPEFQDLHNKGGVDLVVLDDGVGIEKFAELTHRIANSFVENNSDYHSRGVRCFKVEVFEHEKNSALYITKNNEVVEGGYDKAAEVAQELLDDTTPTPAPQKESNAAPLYNTKTDTTQKGGAAPLRSPRDKSLGDILAGN